MDYELSNMTSPKIGNPIQSPTEWSDSQASINESIKSSPSDPANLTGHEIGSPQPLKRNFSLLSILGIGFSLTNSWFGISTALVTGINSGGPVLIIYGIIIIALISTCVGISLSELASALPNAGGQYFWARELAPKGYGGFASYVTGWFAWTGSLFTSASVALGLGSAVVGCIQLLHPDLEIRPWMVLLTYQLLNALAFLLNCSGRLLPKIATLTLAISLLSFTTIIILIPASAPTYQPPHLIFSHFENNTGWSSNTIAFIVGLINPNWAFACLDSATHLADEVQRPERAVPVAIMGTVAIGFVTSWCYSIAMFTSMQDLPALIHTPTGVPILELFHQALQNRRAAVAVEALVVLTGMGCLVASHTWQSRLCWSFARDGNLPFSASLSAIHPTLNVPLNAHLTSCTIVSVLGFLYLASGTAFNSMVTACIVLLYVSYSIPIACLLVRGRENVVKGPFWMRKLGEGANWVVLGWTGFTVVMYSFPAVVPVTGGNMNYVSVVYGVVVGAVGGFWYVRRGRGREGYEVVGGEEEE